MNTSHKNQGFTLIETLFAVLIFSAALVALMTIAGRGISATNNVREQTVAYYLAQEGLEVVRNLRDSSASFGVGFSQCTDSSPCKVAYDNFGALPYLTNCSGLDCEVQKDSTSMYFLDDGIPSGFTREITAIPADSGDEYEIVSKVSWVSKTIDRSVELHTILKDWR